MAFTIVKETFINTSKSMQTMSAGEIVKIPCTILADLSTVRSAATRLNQRVGWTEFVVSTPDKGATLIIERKIKK